MKAKVASGKEPIRQGDVLLVPTELPLNARPVTRARTRRGTGLTKGLVLAAGEATGHHHVIRDRAAQIFNARTEDGTLTYLRVGEAGGTLTHEEHPPIQIPQGAYLMPGQREYVPPKDAVSRPTTVRVYD